MELKELIREVLEQMADVKGTKHKKRYLVEEIEFELSLSETSDGKIGAKLVGVGGELTQSTENLQKVRVKLVPKRTGSSLVMTV